MNFILIGEICSGKDEVAKLLPGKHFAFADDIKEICRLLRNHDIYEAYELVDTLFNGNPPKDTLRKLNEFMEYPVELGKDRKLYQDLGTAWARKHYPDIWLDSVRRKVAECNNAIITDCRFLNEFNAFLDFTSIYVEASEETRRARMKSRDGEVKEATLNNPAEAQIASLKPLCRYVLENNGTIEELRNKVDHMVKYLRWAETN